MANLDFSALVIDNRRSDDDYVSAKVWCQAFDKEWSDYRQTQQCKKLVRALSKKENTTISDIIQSKRGRGSETWVHPVIAIDFAEWLSTDFGIFVKEIFLRYLDGDAELGAELIIRDHNKQRVERAKVYRGVVHQEGIGNGGGVLNLHPHLQPLQKGNKQEDSFGD